MSQYLPNLQLTMLERTHGIHCPAPSCLSYAKIILIIKKSKFAEDVLKYFKTAERQTAHMQITCAVAGHSTSAAII